MKNTETKSLAIIGSIYGDLIGSYYENSGIGPNAYTSPQELMTPQAKITDDSICTIALLDAIQQPHKYGWFPAKRYAKALIAWGNMYPDEKYGYGPLFRSWFLAKNPRHQSISGGNGAVMRLAGLAYVAPNKMERQAIAMTIPSHYTPEAIECARIVAQLYRNILYHDSSTAVQQSIQQWKKIFEIELPPLVKEYPQNIIYPDAIKTLGLGLNILRHATSFNEAILLSLRNNRDTDTQASLVGGPAALLWGIPDTSIIRDTIHALDTRQQNVIKYAAPQWIEQYGGTFL